MGRYVKDLVMRLLEDHDGPAYIEVNGLAGGLRTDASLRLL